MFDRILNILRECVRKRLYVMTLHAEEEMCDDHLTIHDVERGILTGEIVERQEDSITGEWKYRLRGETLTGKAIEVIAKIGPTGKTIIITVYLD